MPSSFQQNTFLDSSVQFCALIYNPLLTQATSKFYFINKTMESQNELNYLDSQKIFINHSQQLYNWDCGLACISMVLEDKDRAHFLNNFSEICSQEGFKTSTWTIDLCFLLWRYKIRHEFYTNTLGVNKDYKNNKFYEQIFKTDYERIKNRFKVAFKCGFKIFETSVDINIIVEHLLIGPIIVLINSYLLNCNCCKRKKKKEVLYVTPLYQGHYIVLCGFKISEKLIFYHNPVLQNKVCRISFQAFNNARKCHGTDEDIMFIFR